jgi:23S rRNA (cytosine1962-C5)-methyltransferase
MAQPPKSRRPPVTRAGAPRVRRGAIRVPADIAWRIRAGHPWVFRDTLGGRPVMQPAGSEVDVLDAGGVFVARGVYDPEGPIAVRLFTREPGVTLDRGTVRGRVERAGKLRERLLSPSLTAYRVVHGEGDGLPGVTVDRYADYLVVHLFSPSLEPLAPLLREALASVWSPRGIYEQHRFRPQTGEGQRAPAQLVHGDVAPLEIEVREGDVKFAVDVTAPLGSGLFIDLRTGRAALARHAAGRRVLNLFSYTGAFSIYAAGAGAKEVVSVDLAARAHGRARRNLQINGLGEQGHEFIVGDAAKVLARLAERRRRFDLVIIDPPSFAQAKGHPFVAQKDYRDLVEAAMAVTEPGGLLACASNTARLPIDDFDRILGDGASRARRPLTVIERVGLPPDFPVPAGFPEGHYLKFEICVAG